MPPFSHGRSRDRRRRWTLAVAYLALLASCDSPFAPTVEEITRLEVSPPVLLMVVGGNANLSAQAFGTDDTPLPTAKVFWSSQNPTVVTVTQQGIATAVAAGTAQIAASAGGLSRTIAVTVSQRPIALVRISPPAGTVTLGSTLALQGEALDGTGALLPNRVFDWSSSAPAVATVNALGVVTGVSVGQATISATGEGKTGTAVVTVLPAPVASITIQPNGGSLPAGATMVLTATVRDAAGIALTGRRLEWSSSNDAVATVSSTGLLTAISAGVVTITVTAPGEGPGGSTPSASVQVTVLIQPVSSALIVPASSSVQVGANVTLTVNLFDAGGEPLSLAGRTITWNSTNTAVATVNSSGIVTGVAVGSTTVRATVTTPGQSGTVEATAQVLVSNVPVASVIVSPNPATVHVGYGRAFTASVQSAQGVVLPGRTIVWTSGNQTIAVVDAVTGVVTGVSQGTVEIRATSEGVQGFSTVTIDLVRVSSVTVTPVSSTLMPGQTVQLSAVPRDSAGTQIQGAALGGRPTSWSTSNSGVATVSTTGLVTGVAVGSANAIATIGGTAGNAQVTVTPLPSASQLAISTQPSATAQNDVAFAVQPVVQLKDASGNNVATAGVSIQAAITAPGTGTLGGSVTAVTNASGAATFSGLKITGTTGARTLTFTSGSLTPATSAAINVQPGVASQLVITTQPPSTANSGQVFSSPTVVQLRDVSGNNVTQAGLNVTAAVNPGAGVTLGGGSASTNAAGTATFSALTLTGPAGSYTLTFSSGALMPATSGAITVGAGSGSRLTLVQQPSASAQNGIPFAQQPIVQLSDGSGNPVAQAGVVVTAAILTGGGALGGTTTATTNASGVATFSDLSITGTIGQRTLLFGASGYTTVTSNAIDITPGAAAALAVVAQPSSSALSGIPFSGQPSVRLVDQSGNAVAQAGVPVSASANGAGASLFGGATVITDASGLASFSGLGLSGTIGTYSLSFGSGSLTGATSSSIDLAAGAAAQLTITTQPAGASSGTAFTTQPAIQVRDAQGNPVSQAGIAVTASIASGGPASLLGGGATTDASGLAQFAGLGLSGTVGNYTIGFASGTLTGTTSATIALGSGAPAQLIIVTQPAGAASGAAFTTQPAVQLRDAQGNDLTTAGIIVNASVNGAGASLIGPTSAATNASGIASFAGLGLSGTVGSYTIDFSSSGVPDVTSGSIALGPGAPAQLVMVTQPSATVVSGNTLAQQPAVRLRDSGGNDVPTDGIVVSAAISAGAASLTGSATATTAGGIATFSGLGITGTAGTYTLSFSASGLTGTTSSSIAVTSGAPTQITFTTQPGGASSGTAFTTQPAIQLRDAGGNPVTQSGVSVSAAIASGPGGGALVGSANATTDASGLATFSGLGLSGTIGNYTITFTSGALPPITSAAIALGPGAPAQMTILTQPAGAVSGAALATQPAIEVRDAQSNLVSQAVTVSASLNGVGAALIGSTTAQTSGGVATFSGLGVSGTVGNYTLDFSTAGAPNVTSASFALTAGAAAQLTMATQPSATVASGSTLATPPAVQLRDGGGNAVSQAGVNITVSIGAGASLSGSATAATDAAGVATFTGLGITGVVGSYTLSFSSSGLTGTTSSAISVTPGAAAQLTIDTQPSSTAISGSSFVTQPIIQLRDAAGNAVSQSGFSVSAALNGAGGSLTGTTSVVTDGSGVAAFSGLGITGSAGSYTITFSGTGVTSVTSSTIALSLPPSALSITAQPSGASSGAAFTTQPVIQLIDANSAPANQAGVQVTAALSGGSGSLVGNTTVTTNASGQATFSDLGISGAVGNYTITFSAVNLTSATSGNIALGPGAPTQVVITTQPSSNAINGTALGTQPTIKLVDGAGNDATSNGIQVTASLNGAGASLSGTTQVSTTNGAATFSGLTITGLVGNYTLTFTAAGVTGTATSGTITLAAGAATQVSITTQPGGAQAGQPLNPQPVVLVGDVSGNPVSGVMVTATKESGSGTLSGTTAVQSDASGVGTYSNLSISQQGGKTLRFTIPSGAFVISGTFNIT